MDFVKYHSLENHYQSRAVDAMAAAVPAEEMCVLTEKVHGANVGVFVAGDSTIRIGRRNGFLAENESFHGIQAIVDDARDAFVTVAKLAREECKAAETAVVVVYGEVFGGNVQPGVFYSSERGFYAFDVAVGEPQQFLDWASFARILDAARLFRSQALAFMPCGDIVRDLRSPLKWLTDLPPVFESTIPERLGQQQRPAKNYAEGYVIKPTRSFYDVYGARIVLKYKNPAFAEVAATAVMPKSDDAVWQQIETTYLADAALRNRLQAVCSKDATLQVGDVKVRGRLVKALANDVIDEIARAGGDAVSKSHAKKLATHASNFIHMIAAGDGGGWE